MANKIQLRRDTTANWARVNPILDDGEPGLNIDTNQIKYGDGANAWVDLSYASGGGSGSTGDWTFTGAVANIASYGNSQIDANGIGGLMLINDLSVTLEANSNVMSLNSDGMLQVPGSIVGPSNTFFDIKVTDTGPGAVLQLGDWDVAGFPKSLVQVGNNVTIATGITTGGGTWTFGADGSLTLPLAGNIHFGYGNAYIQSVMGFHIGSEEPIDISSYGNHWNFNTDGTLTLPNGLTFSSGSQIFEQADHIGAAWATGLNIRGSYTNDPIRIYTYGDDSKGYNAAGIVVNQHSVDIYGNSLQPASPGTKWTFGSDGTLTLPAGGGSGGGDEGAEIDFTKAANSTLSGSTIVVDQYVDKLRFFESGGTNRGAYIDLKQAAVGVGTLLNNRVSAFVNAGTFVTMDNIMATVTTSSNRGLSLATVSGTATCYISGTFGKNGGFGGSSAGVALTTTASVSIFSWDFTSEGDSATFILNDGYTKSYRITMMIGAAYNNNMISIERLI